MISTSITNAMARRVRTPSNSSGWAIGSKAWARPAPAQLVFGGMVMPQT